MAPQDSSSSEGPLNRGWTYSDRVQPQAEGMGVLEFYVAHYPRWPAEVWLHRILAGQVELDGRHAFPDAPLCRGQLLEYVRPPWQEAPVPIEFGVLHDDEHLLAVSKPAGLPTLPGGDFVENTLLHLVRAAHGVSAAPVHRLGRGTSGIVLFARSGEARRRLSADLAAGRLRRIYRALACGQIAPDSLRIDLPIGRVPYAPLGHVYAAEPGGRPALTLCRVVERRGDQTLVEVEIITGRSHQIRIHLAAAGHPLAGDRLYRPGGLPAEPGPGVRAALPGDPGYHLHAMQVSLVHPVRRVEMILTCAPPPILGPQAGHLQGQT